MFHVALNFKRRSVLSRHGQSSLARALNSRPSWPKVSHCTAASSRSWHGLCDHIGAMIACRSSTVYTTLSRSTCTLFTFTREKLCNIPHVQPAECEEPSAALDPLVNSVDRCEPVHKVLAVIVVPLQSPTRMAQHAAFGTATETRLVPRKTPLRLLLLLLVFLTRKPVLFTQRSELILLDTRGAVDPCKCKLGGSARRDWSGCGGARLRHSGGTDRRPSAALSAP